MILFSEVTQEISESICGGGLDYSSLPPEVVSEILNASAVPFFNWEAIATAYRSIESS